LFAIKLGYHGEVMMSEINLIIGVLAIIYGIYSYIQRKVAPEKIEKLQALIERNGEKKRNGEKMANSIHMFGYTILPIVAGLLLLFSHFRG
jgi:ABC-type phosphate transport system permease subunit